jgi:hypothetical protein
MPNEALLAAIKQAYSLAPTNVITLETLEIENPLGGEHLYIVRDRIGHNFTLEDDSVHWFKAVPFRIALPKISDGDIQELTISIDNIDRQITEFVKTVKALEAPTTVKYRPYLSTDLTNPQMSPPLTLNILDSTVTVFEVKIRATFMNFTNKQFPALNQYYARKRFPSLGQ